MSLKNNEIKKQKENTQKKERGELGETSFEISWIIKIKFNHHHHHYQQ